MEDSPRIEFLTNEGEEETVESTPVIQDPLAKKVTFGFGDENGQMPLTRDIVSLLVAHAVVHNIYCPLDLLMLSKVNKGLHHHITKHYPDFGLKSLFPFFEEKLASHGLFEKFLERKYSMFGSSLLCMMRTPFSNPGLYLHHPNDLDLFFSTDRLRDRRKKASTAIKGEKSFLLRYLGNPQRSQQDVAYGTLRPFALYKSSKPHLDLAVGICKDGKWIKNAEIHIQRSPIPAQRQFLCQEGTKLVFRCEKLSNLVGKQLVEAPTEADCVADIEYFCRKTKNFIRKGFYPVSVKLGPGVLRDREMMNNFMIWLSWKEMKPLADGGFLLEFKQRNPEFDERKNKKKNENRNEEAW
jgi:hypothetical protein